MSKKEHKGCSECLYALTVWFHLSKEHHCCAPHGIWNNCHKNGAKPIEVTRKEK